MVVLKEGFVLFVIEIHEGVFSWDEVCDTDPHCKSDVVVPEVFEEVGKGFFLFYYVGSYEVEEVLGCGFLPVFG